MALILATKLCRAPVLQKCLMRKLPNQAVFRTYANEGRDALARASRKKTATLKERAMAPAGDTAFSLGRGALAGGAAIGVGALCYYGIAGQGKGVSVMDTSHTWPEYVKQRIRSTYGYFGASIAVTAGSALAAVRSPVIMNLVMKNGFMGLFISLAAIMGTGMLAQSIEYTPGFGAKQMAWILHTGVLGCMLAPMCFLGGPLLIRAAWYTAGVVGGLSAVAVCAPSEQFLYMGGPLAMGLGVVFVSSIGTMFLPPTTALGAGLYSISLYGGLLLFSAFLLYDTQRIIAQAERYPADPKAYGVRAYDPINASLSIYLDTLNIFIRIATLLAGGGQNRRK